MEFAQRLQALQGNVFADMDQAKTKARKAGKEIIDLSLGSSDLPASEEVIRTIEASLHDPSTHGYLLFHGTEDFRQVVADWYTRKYSIPVDPATEVLPLIGCQEGTAHLPLAILNPGDVALLLDPGYPSHSGGVHLAGGKIHTMPLRAENQFLPIFSDIPPDILAQAKMMVLSYPHNPTTATAPLPFFQEAVKFCQDHGLVLAHDFPYADLVFDSSAPSVFQADREKAVSIEFFTFSKSYNMGGFRIAYAIGNPELIEALRQVKAVIDFNQYRGILNGAMTALTGSQEIVTKTVAAFRERRKTFVDALNNLGWQVPMPQATMYVWARLPPPWQDNSRGFCTQLVEATGVTASPGIGFGRSGEGYVRFALVHEPDILATAGARIAEFAKTQS